MLSSRVFVCVLEDLKEKSNFYYVRGEFIIKGIVSKNWPLESLWRDFCFWREIVSRLGYWRFIGEIFVFGERYSPGWAIGDSLERFLFLERDILQVGLLEINWL